ncbi:MAG TPA: 16S rRNA (adenine(1518)-N(6)/adenine(1519)-N(6))-dimethyltransferase RsmA [Candidatus Dormibacteraeota bacterium]|nr:16S rRNA (adenine(1518)-N(6)/adenine(1519)-N(6))-dimethyltransferase RsmA [Candidatus Dormibacteraeota bacterium]
MRPKKRLGQHFLVDLSAAHRIAALAVAPSVPVLEIGAGTGTLTAALVASAARVTALEIDGDLVAILQQREDIGDAVILCADAMAFDYAAFAGNGAWHVAGNLPYNIATPLVTRLVEMEAGPQSMTVMVQRDVGDRFAAAPGTAAYGSLSVAVQYAMTVRRAFTLKPRAFFPQPKIESAVVQLIRRREPAVRPRDVRRFREVVRAAFAYRRKTLVNSLVLALGLDRRRVERAVADAGIPLEQRGERLDLGDFAKLADALAER